MWWSFIRNWWVGSESETGILASNRNILDERGERIKHGDREDFTMQEKTQIIRNVSRYGEALLSKYPSYLIRDGDGRILI